MCQTLTLTLKYIVVNKTDKGPDLLEHVLMREGVVSRRNIHGGGVGNTAINN